MKYLQRKVARACPFHTAVVEKSVEYLARGGVFSKEEVIEALNFVAVADSIRWDYVREFIEEDQQCDLLALAQRYWLRHKKVDEVLYPERFLASGNGKKTFGYAAVVPQNDHMVIKRIDQRKAMTNGVAKSFSEYVSRVNARRAQNERAITDDSGGAPKQISNGAPRQGGGDDVTA